MGTFSTTALNNMLDTELAAVYAQLHTGDPGASGTANVAGNSGRRAMTFNSASGGVKTQSADLQWTSVSTSETYAWLSFWDAITSGTFLGRAQLSSPAPVLAGNTFTEAQPNITFTLA